MIRTCDTEFRRLVLYPAELRERKQIFKHLYSISFKKVLQVSAGQKIKR